MEPSVFRSAAQRAVLSSRFSGGSRGPTPGPSTGTSGDCNPTELPLLPSLAPLFAFRFTQGSSNILAFRLMEPMASAARAATLAALSAFLEPAHGGSTPLLVAEAKGDLVKGLLGLLCAGIDLTSLQACVSSAHAAFSAAREVAHVRALAAAQHNAGALVADGGGEEDGPWILLPMSDGLLTLFVSSLHSDRCAQVACACYWRL